jgi:aquaporin Z
MGSLLAALLFKLTRPEDYLASSAVREDNQMIQDLQYYKASLPTKLAAEFLGTFMLMLTLGLNTMGAVGGSSTVAATGLSCGAAVLCMCYSVADISGGYFNPAVTFAAVLSRRGDCTPAHGLFYAIIQISAAILAALLYAGLYRTVTFPLIPKEPYTVMATYVLEFMFTFLTAFVAVSTICVKGVKTDVGRNYYFGLAYGFSVAAAGVVAEKVSGGVVNPALSFGISVADTLNFGSLYYCCTFCLAQLFGGLAAALVFYVTHAREYATPKVTDRSLFASQAQ